MSRAFTPATHTSYDAGRRVGACARSLYTTNGNDTLNVPHRQADTPPRVARTPPSPNLQRGSLHEDLLRETPCLLEAGLDVGRHAVEFIVHVLGLFVIVVEGGGAVPVHGWLTPTGERFGSKGDAADATAEAWMDSASRLAQRSAFAE
jgi:hypothetical protein